jgi:DNA-binding XRE family transcriptional regulator
VTPGSEAAFADIVGTATRDLRSSICRFAVDDRDLLRILDLQSEARQVLRELARRRKRAGLSRAELARRMGIDHAELVRLEQGLADPRLSIVARYLTIVGGSLRLTDDAQTAAARSR